MKLLDSWSRRIVLALVVTVALLTGGCGGSGGTAATTLDISGQPADGIAGETSGLDASETGAKDSEAPDFSGLDNGNPFDVDVLDPTVDFGKPCEKGSDCFSGYCLPLEEGKVCTVVCQEECPSPSWQCVADPASYPDVVFICVPEIHRLCVACSTDSDCGTVGDLCIEIGEGTGAGLFCGADCSVKACAEGYVCTELLEEGGELKGKQCVPETGSCICTAELDGSSRTCVNENEFGTCAGKEQCEGPLGWQGCTAATPSAEACDGSDNDCDGLFDEGFPFTDWDTTLKEVGSACGTGLCVGTVVCLSATQSHCSGSSLKQPVESCNAMDDDCDGSTDEDPADCVSFTCVGSGQDYFETGEVSCTDGECLTPNSKGCGNYTCSGGGSEGNECATECVDDTVCVTGAHCDESTGECRLDAVDGTPCQEDGDCLSLHCGNGFCCPQGDCCHQPSDCPSSYVEAASCSDSVQCQGTRIDAVCNQSMCAMSDPVGDDSACDASVLALDCAPYLPVYCAGTQNQPIPACPMQCTQDSQCVVDHHCDGTCLPDLPNGDECDENSDCVSGHCSNGVCCTTGDCCLDAAQCPVDLYSQAPTCTNVLECQGSRKEPSCVSFQCVKSSPIPDDSGCGGLEANDCGPYLPIVCAYEADQKVPICPVACVTDVECDANAHCDDQCMADLPPGSACDEQTDCQAGLYCVDGVCCSSSCGGLCKSCNLPGSEGTCSNIPLGQDPNEECDGLDCSGYFSGWVGDECLDRQDAPAELVGCSGLGSCQAASAICPAQPAGEVVKSCHADCQEPNASTCVGTVAGTCTNVNPGTDSCGLGACFITVPLCVNGSPNECLPPAGTTESCNNIDDDCNGGVDDGLTPVDSGMEPNGTFATARGLGDIPIGGSTTVYGAIHTVGDVDTYSFKADEVEPWCWPLADQPYKVVAKLTSPTGVDCVNLRIRLYSSGQSLLLTSDQAGCAVETVTRTYTGTCPFNDDESFYVVVDSAAGNVAECSQYELYILYDNN